MGKQNVSISSFFSMGGRFKIGGPDDKKFHYIIVSQQKNQNKKLLGIPSFLRHIHGFASY